MNDLAQVLVVEDDDGDYLLVDRSLPREGALRCTTARARSLDEALAALRATQVDVCLLDLSLGDSDGAATVRSVRESAPSVPIVVVTGHESHQVGASCIAAGAHDYVFKREVTPMGLERALSFALARKRQGAIDERRRLLERYRMMLSGASTMLQGPAPATDGTLRKRDQWVVADIDRRYAALLEAYAAYAAGKGERPATDMRMIGDWLYQLEAGPRDLLGIHVKAVEAAVRGVAPERSMNYAAAARSLVIEMMSFLIMRYRSRVV